MKQLSISLSRLAVFTACVAIAGWSQIVQNDGSPLVGITPTRLYTPSPQGASKETNSFGNGIIYHGGPIMAGTINVYYIWYGNWSTLAGTKAKTVLENLAANIGGSPYFNINTTYYDGSGSSVSNLVHYAGSADDSYSQGSNLSDAAVSKVVTLTMLQGRLPIDSNGVYFVLTSTDVSETSGFCTQYCGWHGYATMSGTNIKYAFVGNADRCLSACAEQPDSSPNGDPGVDGMASIIAHELEEAATDPNLNAWYDARGEEVGDKCAWTFGSVFAAGNGSLANLNLGGLDYLIQQNWVNAAGGYCALSYGSVGPALTSIAPANGAQSTTVPVTITGTGFSPNSTINVSPSGIQVTNVVVVNSTQITASFNLTGASLGGYNISVTASAGTTLARTFTVTSLAPTLTSASPSSGAPGTAVSVTLTGANFVSGGTAVNISPSGIITPSNILFVNSSQITATFTVASGAAPTGYNVSVTTGNGTSGTVTFTVAQPAPTLTSISPSSASLNTNTPVTLTGTNFIPGATLNISGSGVSTSGGVTVQSSTQITTNFVVTSNATTGPHNVSVSTSSGTSGAVTFTVNGSSGGGGGTHSPSLSSISPAVGKAGTTVTITLSGTNLSWNPTVQVSGDGVTVTSVTLVGISRTTLNATFVIASNATKSTRLVSVKTLVGTSNTVSFTIQ